MQRSPARNPSEASSHGAWPSLPAIVREGLVRIRHAVRVFLLLHCIALALRRRDDLGRQLLAHRLLVTLAGVENQPAHPRPRAALRTHFDGHLIGCAPDAAALRPDPPPQ